MAQKSKPKPTTPKPPSGGPTDFEPLEASTLPKDKTFFVVIPRPETFKPDEQAAFEAGHYPMRVAEHLPEHVDLVDYLIERSVASWTRSQG